MRLTELAAGGAAGDIRDQEAEAAVDEGYSLVILSDREISPDRVPVSALLATGAVHHHLISTTKRTRIGIVVESGEARASTMFNYVEQNFNMLPRPESKKLQIIKTAVYDHPDGGQMLKIRFRAKKSAKQFEFFRRS